MTRSTAPAGETRARQLGSGARPRPPEATSGS